MEKEIKIYNGTIAKYIETDEKKFNSFMRKIEN